MRISDWSSDVCSSDLASDHAAYELKALLADWLRGEGHEVADLGTDGPDSVDYPDYGYRLAEAIASGSAERGVALCGSGIGISISVTRNPACRCALVSEPLSAKLARAQLGRAACGERGWQYV